MTLGDVSTHATPILGGNVWHAYRHKINHFALLIVQQNFTQKWALAEKCR